MAVRASGPITLDGLPDEAAWNDAPIASHFLQNDPREGEPATFDTEVRVVYDDDALYFGVFAKDDEPGRLIVNDLKKDFDTESSDAHRRAGRGARRLSDFFLVYNERRDERTGQMLTRAVIAKNLYGGFLTGTSEPEPERLSTVEPEHPILRVHQPVQHQRK